jgi:hypothetical protein
VDERARRLAENEALFREVNERTSDVNDDWARREGSLPPFQILCECGLEGCSLPLTVTPQLYESVRAHAARFLVAPGHEQPDVERVVEAVAGVHVVEKTGASKPYVERLDPRSRG